MLTELQAHQILGLIIGPLKDNGCLKSLALWAGPLIEPIFFFSHNNKIICHYIIFYLFIIIILYFDLTSEKLIFSEIQVMDVSRLFAHDMSP